MAGQGRCDVRLRDVTLAVPLMAAIVTCEASAQGSMRPEERLKERKITLPAAPAPVANYVRAVRVGNLLFVSGTTSRDLKPFGKVGRELTVDQGYQAARSEERRVGKECRSRWSPEH